MGGVNDVLKNLFDDLESNKGIKDATDTETEGAKLNRDISLKDAVIWSEILDAKYLK